MATLTMNPVLPVAPPNTVAMAGKAVEVERSFSEHMEKKVNDLREKQSQLGAKPVAKSAAGKAAKSVDKAAKAVGNEADAGETTSTYALLAQLMDELRKLATDPASGPGEWTVVVPDAALLTRLGQEAGMSEADLALLLQQWENQGGKLALEDILAAFGRNFDKLNNPSYIAVPEPELPLLETLLARMGVPVDEIDRIANQSVTGDGNFDLELFLQGLQSVKAGQPVTLTDWEAEQLRGLLKQAGASEGLLNSLLPVQSGEPVTLSLDRLQDLLASAISQVKADRAKADVPAFLNDLEKLLAQAGFEEKSTGWSPVVQGTVKAVHEELVKTVDLASVKIEKAAARPAMSGDDGAKVLEDAQEEIAEKMRVEGEDAIDEWLASGEKGSDGADPGAAGDDPFGAAFPAGDDRDATAPFQAMAGAEPKAGHDGATGNPTISPNPTGNEPAQVMEAKAPLAHSMSRWSAVELHQQVFDQVSSGVLRGLSNNEHQMVLRLHPKELGEVKVNLLVRDDQIAVSFTIENSKVKAMLESSMEQFRNNMERQGFVLDQCFVALDQQDKGAEQWRQFEEAWRQLRPQTRKETLAELPGDVLYRRVTAEGPERNGGISLFA